MSPNPREPRGRAKTPYHPRGQHLSTETGHVLYPSWVPGLNAVGQAVVNNPEARERLSLTSAICSAPGTAERGLAEGTVYTLSAPLINFVWGTVLVINEPFPY